MTIVGLADALIARVSRAIAETGSGLGWIDVPEGQPFELECISRCSNQ